MIGNLVIGNRSGRFTIVQLLFFAKNGIGIWYKDNCERASPLPFIVIRYPSIVGVGLGCAVDCVSHDFASSRPITRSPIYLTML